MENQNVQLDDPNQQPQNQRHEGGNHQGSSNDNTGNIVPDNQIEGSDADKDQNMDTSVNPDRNDDENDASGVGSQTKDIDVDESTGGPAL